MNYLQKKRLALMRNKGFKGYLRRTNGNPLILTDCVESELKSLSICGNTIDNTGVGIKSENLISTLSANVRGVSATTNEAKTQITLNGTATANGGRNESLANILTIPSGKVYTFHVKYICGDYVPYGSATGAGLIASNAEALTYIETIYSQTAMQKHSDVITVVNRKTASNDLRLIIGLNVNIGDYFDNYTVEISCYEGEYSLNNIPFTSPYNSYIIPLEITNGNESKGYNICTYAPLRGIGDTSDEIVINWDNKTAKRINRISTDYQIMDAAVETDITNQIDWTNIPKVYNGITVITSQTLVPPSSMTAEYYSIKPEV